MVSSPAYVDLKSCICLIAFVQWEIATGGEDKGMASISEVMSLSDRLKVLAVEIPSVKHMLAKDMKSLKAEQ